MKKSLALLSVLLLALTGFGGTKTFTVESVNPNCGGNTVPAVGVDDASGLTDVAFKLYYDPSVITHVSCAASQAGWNATTCATGSDGGGNFVSVAVSGPALGGGPMNVAAVTFSVPAAACDNDSTALNLESVVYNTASNGTAVDGTCTVSCPANVPPGAFANVAPADGATGQPLTNVVLDWADSAGAASYDLYFGTANPPALFQTGIGASNYTVAGPLSSSTVYYWYVIASNACGSNTGAQWSFTTAAAAQPTLSYLSSALVDDCATGGAGDGNGIIDPGEDIALTVTAQNTGTGNASGITAVLSSSTPGITITTPSASYPNIPAGGTGTATSAYVFNVAFATACGTTLSFTLDFTSAEGTWSSSFTLAVGSTVVPLLIENFDSPTAPALPAGWLLTDTAGTDGNWLTNVGTHHPPGVAANTAPNVAYFNSWDFDAVATRMYYGTALDLTGYTATQLTFWMYHDTGYSSLTDNIQVQISTNSGGTWTNVGPPFLRYNATAQWTQHTVDLSAYDGQVSVMLGFLGTSDYGNDCHIDTVRVTGTASSPECTPCTPGTPALAYQSRTFTDFCPLGGAGSGNGAADPGETINLSILLTNTGTAAATGVAGTLSTGTAGVTVTTPNAAYPDIAPAATEGPLTPFVVTVAETVACGTIINFTLDVTANGGAYTVSLPFTLTLAGGGPTTYLSEDFEIWPLAGWTIVDNGGCGVWQDNASWGSSNWTGGAGLCADANSDACGYGMDTELRTPAIDLTGATNPVLAYRCNFQDYAGSGDAYTDISIDGGATWTNLRSETNDDPVEGHAVSLDLSAFAGATVIIRFHFVTPGWDWNWQVDEVRVTDGGLPCSVCSSVPPCIPPSDVILFAPADGAADVPIPATLSWMADPNAASYEVGLGLAPTNLVQVGITTGTTFTLSDLEPGTTYYWRVAALNDCGYAVSPVWSFTTAGGVVPPSSTLFIPAVASATGDRASQWKTDIRLMNTGDAPAAYRITFIPADTDGTQSAHIVSGTLAAGAVKGYDDIVHTAFGLSEVSGGLHLAADQPLVAITRTFNDTGEGTYGQFVKGYGMDHVLGLSDTRGLLRQGETGHLIHLIVGMAFRSNIGFFEVTGHAVTVRVDLYSDLNEFLGTKSYDLLPMSFHQVANVFQDMGIAGNHPSARAEVTITGEGAVMAYASIIDNTTNDAVFTPAQKLLGVSPEADRSLAVTASAHGAKDTLWHTDVRVLNPTAGDLDVSYVYRPVNGTPVTQTLTVPSMNVLYAGNVLSQIFNISGDSYGSMEVKANAPLLLSSRIYTGVEGTYGQYLPSHRSDEGIVAGGRGILLGLRTDEGFRTNLGLTEINGGNLQVRLRLFDMAGNPLMERPAVLAPYQYLPVNDLFAQWGLSGTYEGYLVIEGLDGAGRLAAYASVVDNLTGDAIYIPAQ